MLLFISLFLALIASNLIAKTTLKGHVPSVCLSSTMCCIMLGGEVFIMCTERILCVIGPSGLSSLCLSLFTWPQACTVCSCPCMAKFEIEFLFVSWWSTQIISRLKPTCGSSVWSENAYPGLVFFASSCICHLAWLVSTNKLWRGRVCFFCFFLFCFFWWW